VTIRYNTKDTSPYTTDVEGIVLARPDGQSSARMRRIIRAQIVKHAKDGSKPVKFAIHHQRRHSEKEEWQDADSFNLAHLKAGDEVRMHFTCSETDHLLAILQDLYGMAGQGLPRGDKTFEVVDYEQAALLRDAKARRVLQELFSEVGEGVWSALEELRPGVMETVALRKQHRQRLRAVKLFQKHIDDPTAREEKWQRFFEDNDWIFGHGLDYRFLHRLQAQAHVGGAVMDGSGAPKGDYLMATKARVGFTVLVEIKTPTTALLGKRYRNKAHEYGPDLAGGVSQLLAQCHQWAMEGSLVEKNREALLRDEIYTYQPKGILVIGNTSQLDDTDKRSTFELFRRSLNNPQIVTFDELLQRAELMVQTPDDPARMDAPAGEKSSP
jgi:hypothetical protein